jgi:polyhydroxyalkanoate synthesis regulator phasin
MNFNKINKTRLKATLSIVALSISSAFLTACNSTNSTNDRSFARSTDERRMVSNNRSGMRSGMAVRGNRIEAAVENGDMTREKADKMLAQMNKRMADGRKRGEGHDAGRKRGEGKCPDCKRGEGKCPNCKSGEGHDRGESRTINWDGINARIEAAVESGDMTREEADKKLNEIEGRKGKNKDKKSKSHWDKKKPSDD